MPVLLCNLSSVLLGAVDDDPFRHLLGHAESLTLCKGITASTNAWELVDDEFRDFQTGRVGESEYARHLRSVLGWQGDDRQLVALFSDVPSSVHLGALEALRALQAIGWTLVGLENANPWQQDARRSVYERLELGPRRLIHSLGVGARLPAIRTFQLACSQLGASPSDVLYVDRDHTNISAARAAGMHAHLLRSTDAFFREAELLTGREDAPTCGA